MCLKFIQNDGIRFIAIDINATYDVVHIYIHNVISTVTKSNFVFKLNYSSTYISSIRDVELSAFSDKNA